MPQIDKNFLENLKDNYIHYPNFIETGTKDGATIFAVEPYFKKLYTIELSESLYRNTSLNYRGDKITFIKGDSSTKLLELLPNIKGKSIFFLDGHWSGGVTARGNKDCPLYEELESIINFHKDACIVIIDDARLFETKNKCDWSEISEKRILEITQNRRDFSHFLPSDFHVKDRLILHLKSQF